MTANLERYNNSITTPEHTDHDNSVSPILVEGRNAWRIACAHRAAFLIDGADFFSAFAQAALLAQESILILGWDFDSCTRLWGDNAPRDCPAVLGEFLKFLARKRRRLKIYILTWDFPLMYSADREASPLFGRGWRRHRRIRLEYDGKVPVGASHHQKLIVIDNAMAFVGGLDLTRKRWDTSRLFWCFVWPVTAGWKVSRWALCGTTC